MVLTPDVREAKVAFERFAMISPADMHFAPKHGAATPDRFDRMFDGEWLQPNIGGLGDELLTRFHCAGAIDQLVVWREKSLKSRTISLNLSTIVFGSCPCKIRRQCRACVRLGKDGREREE